MKRHAKKPLAFSLPVTGLESEQWKFVVENRPGAVPVQNQALLP